ncbi:hypothetical protein D3C71_1703530 [compost metagenome]
MLSTSNMSAGAMFLKRDQRMSSNDLPLGSSPTGMRRTGWVLRRRALLSSRVWSLSRARRKSR